MTDKPSPHDTTGKLTRPVDLKTTTIWVQQRWVSVRHTTIWHPPTDVYEQDQHLIVIVEIAGMRDGDFIVQLQGNQLIIGGIRQRSAPTDGAYHQLEISFGEFRTEINLPWPVLREGVSAVYRDGFLRVELPRAQAQKVHIVAMDTPTVSEDQTEPDK